MVNVVEVKFEFFLPRDVVPPVDLCKTAHADTADADKVHVARAGKINCIHIHSVLPSLFDGFIVSYSVYHFFDGEGNVFVQKCRITTICKKSQKRKRFQLFFVYYDDKSERR